MNVVTLIGNLATEVEPREVGPDKRVASFVLAVGRASREGGGADFVNCRRGTGSRSCAPSTSARSGELPSTGG